jgi:hypothetical protein
MKHVSEYNKKKMLHWIEYNSDAEVIVEWDFKNKSWNFWLVDSCKKFIIDNSKERLSNIIFFIVKESNRNQLIQTIQIDVEELIMSDKITRLFEHDLEFSIDSISISATSDNNFESYGLVKHV